MRDFFDGEWRGRPGAPPPSSREFTQPGVAKAVVEMDGPTFVGWRQGDKSSAWWRKGDKSSGDAKADYERRIDEGLKREAVLEQRAVDAEQQSAVWREAHNRLREECNNLLDERDMRFYRERAIRYQGFTFGIIAGFIGVVAGFAFGIARNNL